MPSKHRSDNPLAGLRILALGAGVATRCAASWLAESSADVAAFRPGWQPPDEGSPEFAFETQVSRASRNADFDSDAPYDILIADSEALEELGSRVPRRLIDGAITVEVTSPLPAATSFDDALIKDMMLWARSGLGYLTREIDDDWTLGRPCLPLNRQASILAGIAAATAAVTASLENRDPSRGPRHITLDQLELLALMPMQPVAVAQLAGRVVGRERGPSFPGGTVPTANGMAYIRPVEPGHWAKLLRLVGDLDWAAEQVEDKPGVLRESADAVDLRIRTWALERTSEDIAEICQAEHIPVAAVYRPDQVVRDAHLSARGFFDSGHSGSDASAGLRLPWLATIGEAPDEATAGSGAASQPAQQGTPVRPRATGLASELPLAGMRILDLSWAWAGPFAATLLADLGAEVVNVEWHPRASNLRRNPPFAGNRQDSNNTAAWWSANQRGKLSIGIDMKTAEGKEIIHDLAARCDVVLENFSPGVVDRLGVGFDNLVQVNSRLVYVSLSAFGQTGPCSHYIGYGTQLYGAAGAGYATSQDGRTLSQMYIPYPDPISGLAGACAIATYVRNARVTGLPARVDVSELEVVAAVTLEPLLDALEAAKHSTTSSATNEHANSKSNSHRYLVVATSDDRFVALLARTADDWSAFQHALDAGSTTPQALRCAAEPLDTNQLLERVAAAGLLATPIRDSAEVLVDPYLADRGFWIVDQSPEVAPTAIRIGGSIWHIDGQRTPIWRGAPQLFADTRSVLQQLLDYEPAVVDALFARGVIE
jgi:crotonobetainyl-CoA:carnitine CoA-transferase CaiB-like acyl-CoA transferase